MSHPPGFKSGAMPPVSKLPLAEGADAPIARPWSSKQLFRCRCRNRKRAIHMTSMAARALRSGSPSADFRPLSAFLPWAVQVLGTDGNFAQHPQLWVPMAEQSVSKWPPLFVLPETSEMLRAVLPGPPSVVVPVPLPPPLPASHYSRAMSQGWCAAWRAAATLRAACFPLLVGGRGATHDWARVALRICPCHRYVRRIGG